MAAVYHVTRPIEVAASTCASDSGACAAAAVAVATAQPTNTHALRSCVGRSAHESCWSLLTLLFWLVSVLLIYLFIYILRVLYQKLFNENFYAQLIHGFEIA